MNSGRFTYALLLILLVGGGAVTACGSDSPADTEKAAPAPATESLADPDPVQAPVADTPEAARPVGIPTEDPAFEGMLPEEFDRLWSPWKGDLPGMIERRAIRVVVPFGGYQFYYHRGKPQGAVIELLQRLESFLNEELGRGNVRVYVVPVPMSRDRLLLDLLAGQADLVAADLTITDHRHELVEFTRPLIRDVSEVIVTGPTSPKLNSLADLSGKEIVVRESSSYYQHLLGLAEQFTNDGRPPLQIRKADELLEAEDLLEMLHAGMIPLTVMDDYKAAFWSGVFPDLVVRNDLIINKDGAIAWAHRADSPELAGMLEKFLRQFGRGTLVGNDTFNRYLADSGKVRCANDSIERYPDVVKSLQKYASQFDYHWLMLAAQGYQESGLRQDRRSSAGAVGIMQIKPSTAADSNVGVDNVEQLDNNIHAGAKYMRFLADRYFSDDVDALNQWLFALAAYNAGPARVASLRAEAQKSGYDRNNWFDNVEIIAAKRIGSETVTYVGNIYKYYVGYQLAASRIEEQRERYSAEITGCGGSEA
jgi:membrane-bound lytic murein transglycosylase MltF